jgi:type I restriction-modification system DNA methylase subunit
MANNNDKSFESRTCDAVCSILSAKAAVPRIANTFKPWRQKEKYSRSATNEEIAKNDSNISPGCYIHIGEADEYRSIAEIVEELNILEKDAKEADRALKAIMKQLEVRV